MDINNYTNELLLDFLDAFHTELTNSLQSKYGDKWLSEGVFRHLKKDQFVRIEQMLNSPMRVVDMPREPEELYGIEHLANIVRGNWEILRERFQERNKTEVYLDEIAELRHNLAHRRKHHLVRTEDLIRFAQNARGLLQSIGSPEANRFSSIIDSLTQGGKPWGTPLGGQLPPHDEIYDEFIGRPDQLRELGEWFMGDAKPVVVWGYGGAGKSALAFKFAKEVQESAPADTDAVIWLTAKHSEFVEGTTRDRVPDFSDVSSFCRVVWEALYEETPTQIPDAEETQRLIDELNLTQCLIVVDDLDTLLDETETIDFLLYGLRACKSKILYTSRQRMPGLRHIEVAGFEREELQDFVQQRALEYGVPVEECIRRAEAIRSVTGGYPLFVDDLIRYSMLVGIDDAISDWTHRKGDAAREYALSRQLQHLEGMSSDVLIAVAAGNRALTMVEIGLVAGLTDEDAELGVNNLLKWQLLYKSVRDEDSTPVFNINANTKRLTRNTFRDDRRLDSMTAAFGTLTGERIPEAKRRAIATAIAEAHRTLRTTGVDVAVNQLKTRMTGELADAPDLYGIAGWLYAQKDEYVDLARESFRTAHRLGVRKVDPYFHWIEMERRIAEREVGRVQERELLGL